MTVGGILGGVPRDRAMFLVWGPPSHGPRSRVFARELGIDVENVFSTRRRGLLIAPWKYGYQVLATVRLLARRRPDLVFVQSPPSFAAMVVAVYCLMTGGRFVVDAHSAAMQSVYWTRPRFLYRWLARRALATIVTNETFAQRIESWGATALILRDIPTVFPVSEPPALDGGFNVLVVSTYATDEPLEAIVEAARRLSDVRFHVTGDPSRGRRQFDLSTAPPNVRFTGYLDDGDYYALMTAVDAVMCLTTRDDTMQRGACEALSIGTPIITADWPLLRDYFSDGTVHVAPHAEAIEAGVRTAIDEVDELRIGIRRLRREQEDQWVAASGALASLIRG